MRGVVTSGTGTAAAVPGLDVAGKTGTAEFGHADPPHTHAWFIGFADGLAVAIVVEDGGVGGHTAAPIFHDFFTALQSLADPRHHETGHLRTRNPMDSMPSFGGGVSSRGAPGPWGGAASPCRP